MSVNGGATPGPKVRHVAHLESLLVVGVDVSRDTVDLSADWARLSVNRYQKTTTITAVRPSTAVAWTL